MDLTDEQALINFSLAPLVVRRDIAMLGLLYRINAGIAPDVFSRYIFPSSRSYFPRGLRAQTLRRNRQLHDHIDGSQSRMFQRSLFGLIYTYNILPQNLVDSKSVHIFQRRLQRGLMRAAKSNIVRWQNIFTVGIRNMTVVSFQMLFDD